MEELRENMLEVPRLMRLTKSTFLERLKLSIKLSLSRNFQLSEKIVSPFRGESPETLIANSNKVDNCKYSWYSFVPLFLFNEFRQFSNLYYLLLCLSQFYPPFQVGFKVSYLVPLLFILALRVIEEVVQSVIIMRRDSETNLSEYIKILPDGSESVICSGDIKVGDVLKLENVRVPADCVIVESK